MSKDSDKIKGWNWGAFLLTWIWGVSHRVWISLLALIPGVNLIMAVYLGIKGNELAWQRNRYFSIHEFFQIQKLWIRWSLAIYLIACAFLFAWLIATAYSVHLSDEMALRDAKRISDVRVIISAVNHYKVDHDKQCPKNLAELIPGYAKVIPNEAGGQPYLYTADGEKCTVSTRLENGLDTSLGDDSNPNNGNMFDQQAEDLNSYIFFGE